ncbi:MAG: leucine--tRNA ligase [Bacteroidetes bacterium HGW-Bacteroidetes-1]|jgi:leucyl-tRNA synthetase|nr:MAG: leucine--tRNA ligase [Bacteroidetes bacterium HGW-Bacteroidetes-1]
MDYNFSEVEMKWQNYWRHHKIYQVDIDPAKPKFYVLDMFPYPSGAGLHVGHPLGYIASDIYARYKRLKGFNVLHPMGYDAYGLPAEQYAIQTGTHPAVTTEKNIARYREQLDKIGFSFDWDREVRTSDSAYYKWTQWTFMQLFQSWYNKRSNKAESIDGLINIFKSSGNTAVDASGGDIEIFSATQWNAMTEKQQQEVLMHYRLAYLADTIVNWCPALGTVLANDEVSEGLSVRGAHPVERKSMKQWLLRITAYADRLLTGLENIDWSESIKDIQRNWIGKSVGGSLRFEVPGSNEIIEVFTTRPDTIFGATFMVLAPEHDLVEKITSSNHREEVAHYVQRTKNRSERERMAEVKKVSGVFTGAYAINPFTNTKIPVWIADYVLMGYGTGAIMAVPAHDSRDFAFARHYNLPVIQVIKQKNEGPVDPSEWETSYDSKEGIAMNSGFINGMEVKEAIKAVVYEAEKRIIGTARTNFRLRDAIFSRQRYWGEPFPVFYKDGMPYLLDESNLPLALPPVDAFLPTETGEPPLARAINWKTADGYPLETNTMPGFAGSSGYYLRYMDPNNTEVYFSQEAVNYWENVDLYIGGAEHATGHLIYARFWNMFLFDIGLAVKEEPFKKLINQGMIQGRSSMVYRVNAEKMAEYMLWEELKERKLGVSFQKDFRDGSRKFDFFCEEAGIVIEVNKLKWLEKLAHPYLDYCSEKGYRLLLIPLRDFIDDFENVLQRIKTLIKGGEVPVFVAKKPLLNIPVFVSKNIPGREYFSDPIHVDISLVRNDILDTEGFKQWQPHLAESLFIKENGRYVCGSEVEKMSKSKYNVQNPDELIERYGADTLRMYEMFLGPLEQSKPWDTQGIEGVFRFIRKFWRLFNNEQNVFRVSNETASTEELKVLHKTIDKVEGDIERFSFNTAVSALMICVNELTELKCNKREVLEPLTVLISPFAPHLAEELWQLLGHEVSVVKQIFPELKKDYLVESTIVYPVSFNGKTRYKVEFPADLPVNEIEKLVLQSEEAQKWIEGKQIRKIIVVPQRIINVVV